MKPWWCFDKSVSKTYYPFPGCEKCVPPKIVRKDYKSPLNFLKEPDYLGTNCLSLKAEGLKNVLLFNNNEKIGHHQVHKCAFEYVVTTTSEPTNIFIYTVFVKELKGFCEIYMSKTLAELEKSFGFHIG
jgi:hypothetical protein